MTGLNFVTVFELVELGFAKSESELWTLLEKVFEEELTADSKLEQINTVDLFDEISEAFMYRGDRHSGFQVSGQMEKLLNELQQEYKSELRLIIKRSQKYLYLSNLRGNKYYPVFWDYNLIFEIENKWFFIFGLSSD